MTSKGTPFTQTFYKNALVRREFLGLASEADVSEKAVFHAVDSHRHPVGGGSPCSSAAMKTSRFPLAVSLIPKAEYYDL